MYPSPKSVPYVRMGFSVSKLKLLAESFYKSWIKLWPPPLRELEFSAFGLKAITLVFAPSEGAWLC